jgi:hypothetical protein
VARTRPRAPLARYTNYFEVGNNAFEFLMDFGQYQPEAEEVVLHTRIAVGPTHAKLLARTLVDAVERHEAEHGQIPDAGSSADPAEVVLRSLPDFEQRAIDARRSAVVAAPAPAAPRATEKKR